MISYGGSSLLSTLALLGILMMWRRTRVGEGAGPEAGQGGSGPGARPGAGAGPGRVKVESDVYG